MVKSKNSDFGGNILFLGYGYVAQFFCCNGNLDKFNLAASINTSKEKYFKPQKKIHAINFPEINHSILDHYDTFVVSIPPFYQLKTDAVIDKFYDYFLNRKTPYKLIYLSATSVYGDHEGRKVQENSDLKAESINGPARIECEKKYLEFQSNGRANIIILRLAGIYGDKRNNILAIRNKELTHNKASNKIISRTHVADITAIIRKIILSAKIKNHIMNVADNEPCPSYKLNNYICEEILRIDKLPVEDNSKESKHASFALDNKIVDNNKLKKLLNYAFIFPSYKEGLTQIAKNLRIKTLH